MSQLNSIRYDSTRLPVHLSLNHNKNSIIKKTLFNIDTERQRNITLLSQQLIVYIIRVNHHIN